MEDKKILDYITEEAEVRKKFLTLNNEIQVIEYKTKLTAINKEIETSDECLEKLINAIIKINSRKAVTLIKEQSKQRLTTSNGLQLSHKYHKDLSEFLSNIKQIKETITNLKLQLNCNYVELINQFENLGKDWFKKLVANINKFESCEGFYQNLIFLTDNNIEKNPDESMN